MAHIAEYFFDVLEVYAPIKKEITPVGPADRGVNHSFERGASNKPTISLAVLESESQL